MWILLIPIFVAMAVFWGFLAYAAWRAFRSFRTRNALNGFTWLAIISIPFIYYAHQINEAERFEAERAVYVANLPRSELPSRYPRLLEVYGHLTDTELMIYLDALNIDEIQSFGRKSRRNLLYGRSIRLASRCRGVGRRFLNTWQNRRKLERVPKEQQSCLIEERIKVPADRADVPAIVFRMSNATTLKLPSNTVWSGGNYEARLRTGTENILLDYWERPYIPRPSTPGPWGYAFKANTDWKKYRSPNRMNFFGSAVGLLPPRR